MRDVPNYAEKTKEACLNKYNQIAQSNFKASSASVSGSGSAAFASSAQARSDAFAKASEGSEGGASPGKKEAAASAALGAAEVEEGGEGADSKWSPEQQKQLEGALAKYPASMDKAERWTGIGKEVEGKTKKQCAERFKFLRQKLSAAKK